MDLLDEYIHNNLLSKDNILRFVDDYSIYSFYINAELELRTKYSSPLREGDDDPSFSLYESKYENRGIMFKDSASGKFGNVFDFVQDLMSNGILIPMKSVLLQINSDFGIGLGDEEVGEFKPHLVKAPPLKKLATNIQVTNNSIPTQEFKNYWEVLDIDDSTLALYYATNPRIIHYIAEDHRSIVPKELTIAYEILGKYKIYHPNAPKKYKFRNNYEDHFVEGAMQLQFENNFVIITKATKECMWFRQHYNWDTVAGKSETTMVTPYFMEVLRTRFKTVYIWLDPDKAGMASQLKYMQMYPWLIPIVMHESIEQKDVTDFYTEGKRLGQADKVISYISELIYNR